MGNDEKHTKISTNRLRLSEQILQSGLCIGCADYVERQEWSVYYRVYHWTVDLLSVVSLSEQNRTEQSIRLLRH